ncbi:hypothetical protein TWF696_009896 [Orbilia brochopaga]|uniref:Type 1 phosphatases regulator n=1 Tax=Orbilia brochopaga TaxID=3140254 RepID=A0AAV9UGB6_9PEZI
MDQAVSTQHESATASVATTTVTEPGVSGDSQVPTLHPDGILRLRGAPAAHTQRRRVTWTEEVVDNEGLGKKKTKICCIYKKPRQFGESSSEDSSSSSSSDDDQSPDAESNNDPESERPSHRHRHSRDNVCQAHGNRRQRRRNAYEQQPK